MKKIINNKDSYVRDMLKGFVNSRADLALLEDNLVVYQKENNPNKVNLISGGGAGHEPTHAGFIGKGMLDAAVSGQIFTSPTVVQIKAAIDKLNAKETFLVIKNYTGDVLNFKIAAQMANEEGKKVDYVIVDDDVAVQNSTWTEGKRGVAGTLFVHKIAGAVAEDGKNLVEVKKIAQKVKNNIFSLGVALDAGISPLTGKPSFILEEDEYEFGIGIHGEPGIKKDKITSSKIMVAKMIDQILKIAKINKEEIALLVNGMGATPLSELYIATSDALTYLASKNIKVYQTKVGNYMTSLDMKGFSISFLKLDSELKKWLDYPMEVNIW